MDVSQGFLRNVENRGLSHGRELREPFGKFPLNLNSGALLKTVGEPNKSCSQTHEIKAGRMEKMRECPNFAEGIVQNP